MPNLGVAIVRQYERGVVFRFGRLRGVREPVLRWMIPLVDNIRKVTLRTVTLGVLVQMVELKDIELPPTRQRAMARQAEAEREKRAKIIAAEGEALSAGKLAEAADVIAEHPVALQLRTCRSWPRSRSRRTRRSSSRRSSSTGAATATLRRRRERARTDVLSGPVELLGSRPGHHGDRAGRGMDHPVADRSEEHPGEAPVAS